MYAVIATGGKQYRVQVGETLRLEKLPGDIGSTIDFDQVLLYGDGDRIDIGTPTLSGVMVSGRITEQHKNRKVVIFKHKRRKGYRVKQGHRQAYTAVNFTGIAFGAAATDQPETDAPPAADVDAQMAA
jgi:large subunit ribosomal protein L21